MKVMDLGRLYDYLYDKMYPYVLSGVGVRTMLGVESILLSIAYLVLATNGSLLNINMYAYQNLLFPLPVYAIMFLILGVLTLYTNTEKLRLSMFGRRVAIYGCSLFLFFSLSFIASLAITALTIYPVITYAYFCEAFTES